MNKEIWYLLLMLSVSAYSLTNITDKLVAKWLPKNPSLIARYVSSIFITITLSVFIWKITFPSLDDSACIFLLWIVAYLTNKLLYIGLKDINTWKFYMIGYSYLVQLFVINILFFWKSETFAPLKTLFAIIFIIFISTLLYFSGTWKDKNTFRWIIFALFCSFWWTALFFIEWYYTKAKSISALSIMILLYLWSITTGIIFQISSWSHDKNKISKKLFIPATWWALIAIWWFCLLEAYRYMSLNEANILSLWELLATTIFARFILNEKHTKKEYIEIIIWFIILSLFALS